MVHRPPSDKITRHYATCQEIYHLYTTLRLHYEDGVNFAGLLHAIMAHPNLSRVTKHMGNNFDQYMSDAATPAQLRELQRDFKDVLDAYDHGHTEPIKLPATLPVIEVFWICLISHETMDFELDFIRMASGLLITSVFNCLMGAQEARGDLLDVDALPFDDTFTAQHPNPGMPKEIRMAQMLWDAMVDREVAQAYAVKYMRPIKPKDDEGEPVSEAPQPMLH